MRGKILKQATLAAGMMLYASPVAAQVGFQFGGLVSWLYELDEIDESGLGFQAGVHYDLHDRFRVGVRYVNKGIHGIEVPITYRHPTGDFAHLFVGVAPGYDDHDHFSEPLEISALLGLGVDMLRSDARRVQLEAAFSYGLIGAQHDTSWVPIGYKTVRVGLSIR